MRLTFQGLSCCCAGVVIAGGCERPYTTPAVGSIYCRVVIVLAQGESVGNRGNVGCRLTEDEVKFQYMMWLRENSPWFSADLYHNLAPEISRPINPPGHPERGLTARHDDINRWLEINMRPDSLYKDANFDADKINIYFVGDIRNPLPDGITNAFTLDPCSAVDRNQYRIPAHFPHICINDGDFQGTGQVHVECNDHILEHEFCHFLIRQNGTPPPYGNNGRYDQEEHDPNATGINSHLMKALPPHGDINTPDATEAGARAINGTYTQPDPACPR